MRCQCPPKLTPLQSRLAASLLALSLVAIFYWTLSSPHFAYAQELSVDGSGNIRDGADHNWHRLHQAALESDLELDEGGDNRLTDDNGTDGHRLGKRAVVEPTPIDDNNVPAKMNGVAGETTYWVYERRLLEADPMDEPEGLPNEIKSKRSTEVLDDAELSKKDQVAADTNLHARQGDKTVYVSINTCLQPIYSGTSDEVRLPPQLSLYVSKSSDNKTPGPDSNAARQSVIPLVGGFARTAVTTSEELYISVHAPEVSDDFEGDWNYELATSRNDYYHNVDLDRKFLFLVDVDTTSALLVTDNLTQANSSSDNYKEWMNLDPPFSFFGNNANYTRTRGLENSYCGMRMNSQIIANENDALGVVEDVEMGMITRGLGNKPKEQFYITQLNGSSTYYGTLAMVGNSSASGAGVVGGGGKVWQSVQFTTKGDGNCGLLFNLSFCDQVAYAAPSNPNTFASISALAAVYDQNAAELYKNFSYSLQQIPCNTSSDAQYSLAKNCTDCAAAYKEWLCAVTIPRCEDWSTTKPFVQPRNAGQRFLGNDSMLPDGFLDERYVPMENAPTLDGSPAFQQTIRSVQATNGTRNAGIINGQILPGPYKEVLPCEDLCYSLVQSCPASLGFGCPAPGRGLERDYGKRSKNESVTCSYLGAVYYHNAGSLLGVPTGLAVWAAVLLGMILME